MKSEQLFQIDRQITQIKKALEQRHEKINEFNPSLSHILSASKTPDQYLQKKYSNSKLSHYKRLTEGKVEDAEKLLKEHVIQSRDKINKHHNQLKELDELIKKRNMIRLVKLKEEKDKQNVNKNTKPEKGNQNKKKQFSKTQHDLKLFPKMEKEHSALNGLKGQKLLEAYQEGKSRGGSGQQVAGMLKRQLGLGLENTPFYSFIQRRSKQQKIAVKSKTKNKLFRIQRPKSYNLFKTLDEDIRPRKQIYLNNHNQFNQTFQRRLINIMRYHSRNVGLQ